MKEKLILWGATIIGAIIGFSIGGFLGWVFLGVVANFATKFALKKHDEKVYASLTPQEREAVKKEKEEKARIKAEKKAHAQAVIQQLQKEKMKCPRCGSRNIQPAGVHKGGFSVGKAVGGAILAGGVGSLAGFAGKQTGKSDWVCLDCGKSFTIN